MEHSVNKHRTTDYAHQLRPRRHSMDGLSSAKPRPLPGHGHGDAFKSYSKPTAQPKSDENYRLSVSINLPDCNSWRLTKFARQYPYLSIGAALLGLLLFALFMEIIVHLWHNLHHHKIMPALILIPKVL